VREPVRLVVNELADVPRVRRYTLRSSGLRATVRHPLLDTWALEEIFRFRVYAPPPEALGALQALESRLRILDLGGNVGMFALYMREIFPDADIVSFEPDPENARVLRDCIGANQLSGVWQLVEACAAPSDGTVEFTSSYHLSQISVGSDEALIAKQRRIAASLPFLEGSPLLRCERRTVASRDVFPFLENADLVKIDIEGGEWALLDDPRFTTLDAAVVVLEYHPRYRDGDGEAGVKAALSGAGYSLGESLPSDDAAVLWAWKPGPRSS
jgi:FkbM family methyltransferase